jgi:DNA-binding NarL/FixJ family response regulator
MSGIRLVAFDDNINLRDSLTMLLEDAEGIDLIAFFSDCNNVLQDIEETRPDVVLMDIDMPGVNGIEGVKLIRSKFPNIQILMQTVFEDEDKVFAAIKAGAGGYILKNTKPANLIEAIHEVYNGGAPLTPIIARKVLKQFQDTPPPPAAEEYNLSPREKEVLALLVEGLSYKMIADRLFISYETVRSHMKKIYEKLHVTSMTEAVAKAINKNLFTFFF